MALGWYLGLNREALIREQVEAWQYSPVVRSVYDAFKGYGKHWIQTGNEKIEECADLDTIQFLETIEEFYREFSDLHPSKLTHEKSTPWHETLRVVGKLDSFEVVIQEGNIEKHYEERIRKKLQNSD